MTDREGENMNLANMRLAFNADGGASVYKPLMPTESYHHQQQQSQAAAAAAATGGDISFMQHHQQHQEAGSASGNGSGGVLGESVKRKRGRPRKYGPDGSNNNTNNNNSNSMGGGLQFTSPPPPSNSTKKPRGRPPGSSSIRKQQQQQHSPLGSLGVGFTPHVITVQAGEDVLAKVMSFSQNGPRTVCILSANGTISNVTLRQAMTSGGTVTYEGRFEILSLSGSIMLSESGGQRSRTGGLNVSLAGPDGRVLGGGVAGLLTAAAPVQVIVGSFMAEGRSGIQSEYYGSRASAVGSPSSRGNFSESSGGPASPLNQSTGNNNLPGMPNIHWKDT